MRHILSDPRVEGFLGRGRFRYCFHGWVEVVDDRSRIRDAARTINQKYYGSEDPDAITASCCRACLVVARPLLWVREESSDVQTPPGRRKSP